MHVHNVIYAVDDHVDVYVDVDVEKIRAQTVVSMPVLNIQIIN